MNNELRHIISIFMIIRILKISIITNLSVVVVILGVIAFALNVVFTPEKLTPIVKSVLTENLNAKVDIASVDLTFFSSFPNFSLSVKDGVVINNQDSLAEKLPNDTILSFNECKVDINPIAFIVNNDIKINAVELITPQIYAYVDKQGVANWSTLVSMDNNETIEETKIGRANV